MQYSARIYARNRKKWENVNKLTLEINATLEEASDIGEQIDHFKRTMLVNLANRVTNTGVLYNTTRLVVIGKRGIGLGGNSWNGGLRFGSRLDSEYLSHLKQNKKDAEAILKAVKKPDKREILACFIRNSIPNEKEKLNFEQKVNKNVLLSDKNEFRELLVKRILVSMGDSARFHNFDIRCHYQEKENTTESYDLNDNDIETNMAKEQLYLPIWKLLIKVKRHANKKKRMLEKQFAKIKKETEPYWVAERIWEAKI